MGYRITDKNTFYGYDRTVADGQLATYRKIFVDTEHDDVIDDEFRITEILEELKMKNSNEQKAMELTTVIRALGTDECALENFESYLSEHFNYWYEDYASTPEGLINELASFGGFDLECLKSDTEMEA